MKYIVLDTSHIYLHIGLVEDDVVIENHTILSHKSQSENIIPTLHALFSKHQWTVDDLDGVVITKGPGSYTGVRIAMTVAKVLCTTKQIALYTLSSLQAFAGTHPHVCALLDARSNRLFVGVYHHGVIEMEDSIRSIDEVKQFVESKMLTCVGDTSLIGKESLPLTVVENMVQLRPLWETVVDVHQLTPTYLKEQDAYGK